MKRLLLICFFAIILAASFQEDALPVQLADESETGGAKTTGPEQKEMNT
ncbi:hypothetical protein [Sediminibacillus massiliensis]|nr:hypothetical protein [Sediminibacillus massiliensis]